MPKKKKRKTKGSKAAELVQAGATMGAAVGTAIPVVSPTPLGAATGALIALGGLLMSSVIGPFSARKLQEEMDAIKDAIDQVPPELRTGKEWDEIFAPMVVRHLGFALRERSKVKLEAARVHLRKCLAAGVPAKELGWFEELVGTLLDQCTEYELILLLRAHDISTKRPDFVEYGDDAFKHPEDRTTDPYLLCRYSERQIVEESQLGTTFGSLALAALIQRELMLQGDSIAKERPADWPEGFQGLARHSPMFGVTPLGRQVAEWLQKQDTSSGVTK
ncbi:MAG: hypothetical protein IT461_01905 [Planctomycetes bacterium]|nr:hypothetical protein [Planctomycetota bacterium]